MSSVRAMQGLQALRAQHAAARAPAAAQVGQEPAETGIPISTIAFGVLGVTAACAAAYLYGQHRAEKKAAVHAERQLTLERHLRFHEPEEDAFEAARRYAEVERERMIAASARRYAELEASGRTRHLLEDGGGE